MNICIFGDSITWGVNDYEKGGWAERLKTYYIERHGNVYIYNLGISGDNTGDLVRRFKVEAKEREPNLIIFAIGINDSQYIQQRGNYRVLPAEFQKNLSQLVGDAKKLTDKIVFLGLTEVDESKTMPIPWNHEKYYDNESIKRYDKMVEDFCGENDARYVSMKGVVSTNELEDGLHPNAVGHENMFRAVLRELDEFLRPEK